MYETLLQPISVLAGIGTALEKRLATRGVFCLGDLLLHLPRCYVDDRISISMSEFQEGVEARTQARVMDVEARGFGKKRQTLLHLADESGNRLQLLFFHSQFLLRDARLKPGHWLSVRGIPEWRQGVWQMLHPQWIPKELYRGSWQAEYSMLAGLGNQRLRGLISKAIELLPVETKTPLDICLKKYPSLKNAMLLLHKPSEEGPASSDMKLAFERLQLEELLSYLFLMLQKRKKAQVAAPPFLVGALVQRFVQSLPYPLTTAQQHVWTEIQDDLGSGRRMHRLLQGDVGSGKTWVAALCMLAACENDFQSAIMAPTEVLAAQHVHSLNELFQPMGIEVHLLYGGMRAGVRRDVLEGLANGNIKVVVGTHALISEDVRFAKLGLAVVDEQHRFGVRQRWELSERGDSVHLLAMTATPIPRSLALALYGDMDLSLMQGMPPGRKQVKTSVISSKSLAKLAKGMQRILEGQGRIYWIVPRIDEDDDGISVEQRSKVLKKKFPMAGVQALHGRMSGNEKQGILEAFTGGSCKMLVSTTVVEVGVDVAEANLIVIEQADRYGLAQLHQLRGRVGRDARQGYCVLLPGDSASETSIQRLKNMCSMHNGLDLAELDLKLRGAGDAAGTRQSGEAEFRLLDPGRDAALIRHWHKHLPLFQPNEDMIRFWRLASEGVD